MSKSKIDWTDETINPFTGCRGPHGMRCPYCYAQRMATRLAGIPGPGGNKYRQAAEGYCGDPFGPAYHQTALWSMEHVLERRRKPRRVFIGSMGDMCFHGSMFCPETFNHYETEIYTEELQKKIAVFCTGLPHHTFQILTKRPDLLSVDVKWPSNVHLGVSLSRDEDAHRIATLLDKKAVGTGSQGGGRWHPQMVLWASVEPLLDGDYPPDHLRNLDWVVIGAETGRGKSPSHEIIDAAKWIVHWCGYHNLPCFVKDNMRQADPDCIWPRELPR